jgi:hypothetical protein
MLQRKMVVAKISDTDIDEDTETFLNFIDNFFLNFLFIFSKGIIREPTGSPS